MSFKYVLIFLIGFLLFSCSTNTKTTVNSTSLFESDSISLKIRFSETFFVVPSPYMVSFLIKKSNVAFDNRLLTPNSDVQKYTTTQKKSLVLGMYGADLSYLNIYERRDLVVLYISTITTLMEDIGINQSGDNVLLAKIGANIGENDSVISAIAQLYRNSDRFLKDNDRRDVCNLIIAGGWIESFWFLTQLYHKTGQDDIFSLILYQSDVLDKLIKLLSPYYEKSKEFTNLTDQLVTIANEFDVMDKLQLKPVVDTDTVNRITTVHNQIRIKLTGSKLDNIVRLVSELRNNLLM
jgi:hypothetical protein